MPAGAAALPVGTNCGGLPLERDSRDAHPAAGAGSVGGTTFANGQMSHAGIITGGCAAATAPASVRAASSASARSW